MVPTLPVRDFAKLPVFTADASMEGVTYGLWSAPKSGSQLTETWNQEEKLPDGGKLLDFLGQESKSSRLVPMAVSFYKLHLS